MGGEGAVLCGMPRGGDRRGCDGQCPVAKRGALIGSQSQAAASAAAVLTIAGFERGLPNVCGHPEALPPDGNGGSGA